MNVELRSTLGRTPVFAGLLLAAGWLVVMAYVAVTAPPPQLHVPAPPPVGMSMVAPADGDLMVGTVSVAQLPGTCADHVCRFVVPNPSTLPVVAAHPGQSLPLSSDASTSYTASVTSGDVAAPALTVSGSQLHIPAGTSGSWVVTVSGSAGGVWQLRLNVA